MTEAEEIEYMEEPDTGSPEEKQVEVDPDTWKLGTIKDVQKAFGTPKVEEEYLIPLDEENETYMKMYVIQLPLHEQLDLLERFMTFGKKGEAKLKWRQYYASAYTKMVVRTEPPIPWKKGRFYNNKFMSVLRELLPYPMDIESNASGIKTKTRKNS